MMSEATVMTPVQGSVINAASAGVVASQKSRKSNNVVGAAGRSPVQKIMFVQRLIAKIDRTVSQQLSEVLHHPKFVALEAAWRGLEYLVIQADDYPKIIIRALNVSRKELFTDLKQALEFDQSQIFNKIYNEEFGMPGGKPYGVLLGNYEFSAHPEDIEALQVMSQVAASAFTPFIAAASHTMFGLDDINELARLPKLEKIFKQPQYMRWNTLRQQEDSRFVGLTLPHFLLRGPYEAKNYDFCFQDSKPEQGHLWGNGCFAFGAVLLQSFINDGWLADIRGISQGEDRGGVVPENVVTYFATDSERLVPKLTTDVLITDNQEKDLNDLGFIPLCRAYGSDAAVFYSNASIQKSRSYKSAASDKSAQASTMLQHLFCASRFAHYLKVIGRDKVGSFISAGEHESSLNNWLLDYVASNSDLAANVRRKYPLQEAKVEVKESIGKPGSYRCVIHLRPYFQLEQVVTNITLVTELVSVVKV